MYDSIVSAPLLHFQRGDFDFSNGTTSHVCIGYSNYHSQAAHPRFHWVKVGSDCEERRENGCWNQSNQLDQYHSRHDYRGSNWLAHIQKVRISAGDLRYYILKTHRTIARSQQLEAEERNNHGTYTAHRPGFSDESDEQAAANLLRDDEIDFPDHEERNGFYRDEFTDDEDDVFRSADADEEDAINLVRQPSRR